MPAKFVIKKSTNGQFYFNLKAGNGETVLTSETYTRKEAAQAGIASVRVNAPLDERYERKTATNGQFTFLLKAANGEPNGRGELYTTTKAREDGIAVVKREAPGAAVEDLS